MQTSSQTEQKKLIWCRLEVDSADMPVSRQTWVQYTGCKTNVFRQWSFAVRADPGSKPFGQLFAGRRRETESAPACARCPSACLYLDSDTELYQETRNCRRYRFGFAVLQVWAGKTAQRNRVDVRLRCVLLLWAGRKLFSSQQAVAQQFNVAHFFPDNGIHLVLAHLVRHKVFHAQIKNDGILFRGDGVF